jgi:hypothetical protein
MAFDLLPRPEFLKLIVPRVDRSLENDIFSSLYEFNTCQVTGCLTGKVKNGIVEDTGLFECGLKDNESIDIESRGIHSKTQGSLTGME